MNKNIKRIVKMTLALALVVAMSIAFFGCNDYVAETGVLEEGYVPNPSGKIKLQYYIASTESDKRSCNDWVAAFHDKYPNVEVEAEISSRGKSAIQAEIAAKSCGDVFFLWETDVYNYAAVQNVLMPLDYYVDAYSINLSNVYSAVYNMGVVEGKLYMVMRDFNHIALMYNRDIVNSQGLTDPIELERSNTWDWDTFKDYCAKLTTEEGAEKLSVGASLRLGYAPLYMAWLEGWGGKWYDTEAKKVTFISDDKVLQAVNEMVDFVKSNTCKYNVVSGESVQASASQKTFGSDYESVFYDTEFPNFASGGKSYDNKSVDWDCVSMPAYPVHKVGVGATGFAVFNGTKNKDAAAALCLSLYTEDGQKAYNGQEGGSVPNVKSLAEADFWRVPWDDKPAFDENGNSIDNIADKDTKNYYAWVSFPEADTYGQVECVVPPEIATIVSQYMKDVVSKAVNGTMSASDTLSRLEETANQKWQAIYKG